MRIIGGHDYYDSGMAWGLDKHLLFLRNGSRQITQSEMRTVIKLPQFLCSGALVSEDRSPSYKPMPDYFRQQGFNQFVSNGIEYSFVLCQVIFCGTLYRGICVDTRGYHANVYSASYISNTRWIWTIEALHAYAEENKLVVEQGKSGRSTRYDYAANNRAYEATRLTADEWLTPTKLDGECLEMLITNKITIASLNLTNEQFDRNPWLIDQPTLSDMGFAKAVDPYTAFQEISMWKGGVLPKDGPPMVEITDNKTKIEKHGFHHPTSFRHRKD